MSDVILTKAAVSIYNDYEPTTIRIQPKGVCVQRVARIQTHPIEAQNHSDQIPQPFENGSPAELLVITTQEQIMIYETIIKPNSKNIFTAHRQQKGSEDKSNQGE